MPAGRPDTRRQELTGAVTFVAGGIALGLTLEREAPSAWAAHAPEAEVALLLLALVNLTAGGFFALLGGLDGHLLSSDRSARLAFLARLSGANLLIPIFWLISYDDSGGLENVSDLEAVVLLAALLPLLIISRAGLMAIRRGWRHEALSADELLAMDARPPLVYLRSFIDDHPTGGRSRLQRSFRSVRGYTNVVSFEQELSQALKRIGPVVAIGRPGERLPELGAARLYVDDDEWQTKVSDLMDEARFVIVRMGPTAGLRWELERAVDLPPEKPVIFICLSLAELEVLRVFLEPRFGPLPVLAASKRPRSIRSLAPDRKTRELNRTTGLIVVCDGVGAPSIVPIVHRWTPRSLALVAWRPHQEAVEFAVRRVLGRLGLPWLRQKSRTTALLLALILGIVGGHHFYLANHRRGVLSVTFFFTLIPLLIAWRDVGRFIIEGEAGFRRRFPVAAAGPVS